MCTSDGKFKCFFCGGDVNWESDANASDVSDMYDEDDTATVSYYSCSRCGRSYEIIEPPKSERETFFNDYWREKE